MGDDGVVLLMAVALIICFALLAWETMLLKRSDNLDRPLGRMHFDVYLINMDRSPQRLLAFQHAYKHCDISRTHSLIRFAGVDGKSVPLPQYVTHKALEEILEAERVQYRSKHYQLTRGGVGCFLSHANLWRTIMDADKECALIFEDDAYMARNAHAILREMRPPADWDVVLLGYVCRDCDEQEQGDFLKVERFFGLHGYFIHRRGISKILQHPSMTLVGKQIDSVLCDLAHEGVLNIYASPTEIVWQNNKDFGTTIQMPLRKVKGVNVWE